MVIDDKFYISLALQEAWRYQLLTFPNPSVGALVVKNGEILSLEAHQRAGDAHAEVLALKAAYLKKNKDLLLEELQESSKIHRYLINNHKGFFYDCELYITLEPCNHIGKTPACSDLIAALHPKRVIISIKDPNKQASGGIEKLKSKGIEVISGVCKKEGLALLYPFMQTIQNNRFIFFKLATRANGSINGGYITSKESLRLVHKLRAVIDLLVIGGNSVRIDRPTLDCRFIDSIKAPNVLIYSKNRDFDQTIPLFNVENRDVVIENSIDFVNGLTMIEGGYNLLKTLYDKIDLLMLFISPNIKNNNDILLLDELRFEILYSRQIGEDMLVFLKKADI